MINLLPHDHKQEIRFGRLSGIFFRYSIYIFCLAVLITLLAVYGFFALGGIESSAQKAIANNAQEVKTLQDQKKAVEDFKGNLILSNQLLKNRHVYSIALVRIGNLVPKGAYINSLTLSQETYDTPFTITATAVDHNAALLLKSNLEKSEYFEGVSIERLTVQTAKGGDDDKEKDDTKKAQPIYEIDLKVTMSKEIEK